MKKIAYVTFTNGSRYTVYLPKRLPKLAKEAEDRLLLRITPEKGRGDPFGCYMNIYDMNNLIWVLSAAILEAQELGIPNGVDIVKERVLKSTTEEVVSVQETK